MDRRKGNGIDFSAYSFLVGRMVAVATILIFLAFFFQSCEKQSEQNSTEMNEQVSVFDVNAFKVSVNETIEVKDNEAFVNITNERDSRYYANVVLFVNGDEVFTSGIIKQGQFIESISLDDLSLRSHYNNCKAKFEAIDPDTLEVVGVISRDFSLEVIEDEAS